MASEETEPPDPHVDASPVRGWDGFEALYRRYWPRLARYCARLTGDRATGEDVAQDALLRAYAGLGHFETGRPMWPWLTAIARHAAADRARRPLADLSAGALAPVAGLDVDIDVEERQLVATALARVPSRQRRALGLRYVHGWSTAEGAAVLGVSRGAFQQLLARGRARLRAEYERVARDVREPWALLVVPLAAAARRVRLALHRLHAAVSDAAAGAWARVDPGSAVQAAVCTSVACHMALVALTGLGAGSVPDGDVPRAGGTVAGVGATSIPTPSAPGPSKAEVAGRAVPPGGGGTTARRAASPTPGGDAGGERWRWYAVQTPVVNTPNPDEPGPLGDGDIRGGIGWPCRDGDEAQVTTSAVCDAVFEPPG